MSGKMDKKIRKAARERASKGFRDTINSLNEDVEGQSYRATSFKIVLLLSLSFNVFMIIANIAILIIFQRG